MDRFQINLRILDCGNQKQRALLVLDEQVLDVGAGYFPAQPLGILYREHRWMLERIGLDGKRCQIIKKLGRGHAHRKIS